MGVMQADPPRAAGQLFRWILVSGVSFLANLGITVACTELLELSPPQSFGVALVVVQLWNFLAIRHLIFTTGDMPLEVQARRYIYLALSFRVAEWLAFKGLHAMGGADYRFLVVSVLALSSLVKFVAYRHWLSDSSPGHHRPEGA